jgi:hypothetical protein
MYLYKCKESMDKNTTNHLLKEDVIVNTTQENIKIIKRTDVEYIPWKKYITTLTTKK